MSQTAHLAATKFKQLLAVRLCKNTLRGQFATKTQATLFTKKCLNFKAFALKVQKGVRKFAVKTKCKSERDNLARVKICESKSNFTRVREHIERVKFFFCKNLALNSASTPKFTFHGCGERHRKCLLKFLWKNPLNSCLCRIFGVNFLKFFGRFFLSVR